MEGSVRDATAVLQVRGSETVRVWCAQMQLQMQQQRIHQYSSEVDASPRAPPARKPLPPPLPSPVIRQRSDGKPERQAAKRFKSAVQMHGEGMRSECLSTEVLTMLMLNDLLTEGTLWLHDTVRCAFLAWGRCRMRGKT